MPEREDESKQLAVRDKWKHEALDFTRWLAKNLNQLGDELGMKLELVQTEWPVGPYYLDILAEETNEGVKVAIENQLEETNLQHLGQLLTYATGCDAPIAIWIAPEFGYEHAQALHRLNKWTNEGIRFYGVRVEVVKTAGTDCLKARFRKVVYPGDWNTEITLRSGEMQPTTRRYYDFFQPLVDKLLGRDFADKAESHFGRYGKFFRSRFSPSSGYPRIGYAVSLEGRNDAWSTLHIRTEDIEQSNQIFDALEKHRKQIEKCIEAEWHWQRRDRNTFSSISIRTDCSIDDSPEKQEQTRNWMLDQLPKLKEVFDPHLCKILDIK